MRYITDMTEVRKQLAIYCAGRPCEECPLRNTNCDFELAPDACVAKWYTMIHQNAYIAIALDE